MPLEGLWWADAPRSFHEADKSAWKWTAMILQPDVIGQAEIDAAFDQVGKKKNPAALGRVRFETLTEGLSAQLSRSPPIFSRQSISIGFTGSPTGMPWCFTVPERLAAAWFSLKTCSTARNLTA
jgi:hypothetical protein